MEYRPKRKCDYDYVNNTNKTNLTECCNMKPVSYRVRGGYTSNSLDKLTLCNFTVNC